MYIVRTLPCNNKQIFETYDEALLKAKSNAQDSAFSEWTSDRTTAVLEIKTVVRSVRPIVDIEIQENLTSNGIKALIDES